MGLERYNATTFRRGLTLPWGNYPPNRRLSKETSVATALLITVLVYRYISNQTRSVFTLKSWLLPLPTEGQFSLSLTLLTPSYPVREQDYYSIILQISLILYLFKNIFTLNLFMCVRSDKGNFCCERGKRTQPLSFAWQGKGIRKSSICGSKATTCCCLHVSYHVLPTLRLKWPFGHSK